MSKIIIDLTDLILWYRQSNQVSGIQRVLENIFSQKEVFTEDKYCYAFRIETGSEYFVLDKYRIYDLIDSNNRDKSIKYFTSLKYNQTYTEIIRKLYLRAKNNPKKVLMSTFIILNPKVLINTIRKFIKFVLLYHKNKLEKLIVNPGDTIVLAGAFWCLPDSAAHIVDIKARIDIQLCTFVYDIIPITHAVYCPPGLSNSFKYQLDMILPYSTKLVTISNFSKMELIKYARKTDVDISEVFILKMGHKRIKLVNKAKNLNYENLSGEKFFLCVGTVDSRKNPGLLLNVWKKLYKKYGECTPKLIFAGKRGWDVDWLFEELDRFNYVNEKIKILHWVDDENLAFLYDECMGVLFPSFMEGWGLPIEEAIAHGKAVIASNSSSLMEVGRNAAIYIDPLDEVAAFNAICSFIDDPLEINKWENQAKKLSEKLTQTNTWSKASNDLSEFLASES